VFIRSFSVHCSHRSGRVVSARDTELSLLTRLLGVGVRLSVTTQGERAMCGLQCYTYFLLTWLKFAVLHICWAVHVGIMGCGVKEISQFPAPPPPPRFMNVLKIFSLLGISIQILNVLISCVMWPQLLDEGFPVICVFLYQFFCRLCPLEFAAEANRKNYVKILEIILTISLPAVWFQTFSRLYFFRKISLSVFAGKWNFLLNILKGLLLLN